MNTQRVQLQPAYLLHQRAYRDSSIIADIFSAEFGRCTLIAKGVKRPGSKLRGTLQLFQPILVSWISRTEMGTLTGAEYHGKPLAIEASLFPSVFYLNELLLNLLHRHDPHVELFDCYDSTLRALSLLRTEMDDTQQAQQLRKQVLESRLRAFELILLDAIGYGLVLDRDMESGEQVEDHLEYEYILSQGVVRVSNAHDRAGRVFSGRALRYLSSPESLISLGMQSGDHVQQVLREAKFLLRSVIENYMGHKTLRSREMYQSGAIQSTKQNIAEKTELQIPIDTQT